MLRRFLTVIALAGAITCTWAASAGDATIVATPDTVTIGGPVTISGDVLLPGGGTGCGLPGEVILISGAFPGEEYGPGHGAIHLPVDASGHFSETVPVNPPAGAGTYTISGRCGGGNMGVDASLTVTGLPRTGGSLGVLTDTAATAAALVLVLLGAIALALTRRRAPRTP